MANGQGTITLNDSVKARLMALEALRGTKVDAGFLAGRSPARLRRFLRDIHPSIEVVIGTKGVVRDFGA